MEEPDPAIYTVGRCCISDAMPKYECIECGCKGLNTKDANSPQLKKKPSANKD